MGIERLKQLIMQLYFQQLIKILQIDNYYEFFNIKKIKQKNLYNHTTERYTLTIKKKGEYYEKEKQRKKQCKKNIFMPVISILHVCRRIADNSVSRGEESDV